MEVQRDNPVTMICVCRIRQGEYGIDSCVAITSGPDEPVCEFCLAAQHPDHPGFDPAIKDVFAFDPAMAVSHA